MLVYQYHTPHLIYSQLFGSAMKSFIYYNSSQLPRHYLPHMFRKPQFDREYHTELESNHNVIHGMLNENNFFVTSTGDTIIKEVSILNYFTIP